MSRRSFLTVLFFFPLGWVFAVFLLTQVVFALGGSLAGAQWIMIAALVLTGVSAARLFSDAGTKAVVSAGAATVAAWVALSGVAALVHDFSYDGQAYHQEAIIRLAQGWNPWTDPLTPQQTNQYQWLNGYPKITWQVGVLTYRIWGGLETAKVAMWLVGVSATGFAALWAARIAAVAPAPRLVWALFLLTMLNPIALSQWATFQLDGFVYWCLVGLLGGMAAIAYPRVSPVSQPAALVTFALFTLALATAKFTGVVFAVYATLVMGALLWYRRSTMPRLATRSSVFAVAAVILVGVLALCVIHPYLHNAIRYRHPLWPVLGPNPTDIIGYAEHPEFVRQNRVVKFLWANNARARNIAGFRTEEDNRLYGKPRWKLPFAVYRSELSAYVAPDVHVGGFGPWFGGALLAGTVLLLVCAVSGTPGARSGMLVWAVVWGGVLINPEAWWVRYSPHAWWLVLIPVAVAAGADRPIRVWGYVLSGLLLLNVSFVGVINTAGQVVCERSFARQHELLRAAPPESWYVRWGNARSNRRRFAENGLTVVEVSPEVIAAPSQWHQAKLARTDTVVWTQDAALAQAIEAAAPGK